MNIAQFGLAAVLLAAPLNAQMIEDFETGIGAYTAATSGANLTLTAQGSHDGTLGAVFGSGSAGWYYRTDTITAPGDIIRGYVRTHGTAGRIYMGFAADASGCWSAVAAPNTSKLEFQRNSSYGFSTVGSVSFNWTLDVWYLMELDWESNGLVTIRLFDESGQTLLATAGPYAGPTQSGGFAMRGFANGSDTTDFDTVRQGAINASLICLGDGSGTICPCGNINDGSTGPGAGCANSQTSGGALLTGLGTSSLSSADLVLKSVGAVPNTPGLFFQGDFALAGGLGNLLGDGLLCGGGSMQYLQVVFADANGEASTTVNIGALGNVQPSDTRVYQLWYRDGVAGPCGTGSNLTNGMLVTWEF